MTKVETFKARAWFATCQLDGNVFRKFQVWEPDTTLCGHCHSKGYMSILEWKPEGKRTPK
jgi:hypothetical protein